MVEEKPSPPVPLDRVRYAAQVAYDLLSKQMTQDQLRALMTKRSGKGVTAEAAELFLSWLKMAAPCLALDLVALGVDKVKNTPAENKAA